MSTNQEQGTLSGQQVHSLTKYYNDELVRIRKDIELRKWVLDRAIDKHADPDAAIAFAIAMHAFLLEEAVNPDSRKEST